MFVTLEGMVTEVRLSQQENTHFSMLVTLEGMMTDVRPERLKAASPMLVTLVGMVTDVRLVQFSKAQLEIDTVPLLMLISPLTFLPK
jgi:hypothetical protein